MSEIIEALKNHDLHSIKQILLINPNAVDDKNESGVCFIFIAAKTGNFEIVKYIVEYSRASMDIVDEENRNILHYASHTDNVELVEYLVERVNMSPTIGDINLITPLHIANSMGNKKVQKYFEKVCGCILEDMYTNPIRTGTFPDPSIVCVGEDFYMVNSSFIYFPAIPISHSKDLIHWNIIGHAITDSKYSKLEELESGRGYWAPDISYYNGKFYIAVTYRLNDTGTIYRKQIVVSSDKPEGPYSNPAIFDEDGIDPSIFNDEDGKRYMLLNRGARIFEINDDATEQLSQAKLLWYGHQKRAPEGAHILKKDDYYYLFVAEGGTGIGHRISVARSKTLMGNYESCPYNPIMRQMDSNAAIQRAGHGKAVKTRNGEWYMVYLCGRMIGDGYSILGRETALDPITWTKDGWPLVNNGDGPSALQKKPNLPEYIWEDSSQEEFEGEELGKEWMSPRNIEKDKCNITNSWLKLKGSKYDLNDMRARNVILRRQKDFCFNAETKMQYSFDMENQNCGITCYYDENTYLKYGVFMENKGYNIKVMERVGENEKCSLEVCIECTGEIYLKIETRYLNRDFYYSFDGVKWNYLGGLDNVYYLCDEGYDKGKRFTGAMVGMYAVSNKESNLDMAMFDYFYYYL
jgi:xylan 1,4-beta-xylosidase